MSQVAKNLLASGMYSGFFLIDIDTNGTQMHYTTLPYSVTIGGTVYDANNSLLTVDPPRISNTTDKASYKVVFADPAYEYAGLCDTFINSKISIRGGFNNTTGSPVIGSDTTVYGINAPILDPQHFIIIYKGFVDGATYTMTEEDGVVLTLSCGSPMANLDSVNSFYTTRDALSHRVGYLDLFNNPDTAFDYVSLTGIRRSILWGKI